MELIVKNKVIDYIRSQLDYEQMRAHILKMMNVATLKEYSDFLHMNLASYAADNKIRGNIDSDNICKDSDLFIIKHDLVFLVYKEIINIFEAKKILLEFFNRLKFEPKSEEDLAFNVSTVQKMLDELMIFVCIELNLYETSNSIPLTNTVSIFSYLSKIFISDRKHLSYKNLDDLNNDLNKILKLSTYSQAYSNMKNILSSELLPYLSGEEDSVLVRFLPQLSYGKTLYDLKNSKNSTVFNDITGSKLKEAVNSISIIYSDGLKQHELVPSKNFLENSIMKNGDSFYGKYSLCAISDLNNYIDNCGIFINLCEEIRNRMVSYAIN